MTADFGTAKLQRIYLADASLFAFSAVQEKNFVMQVIVGTANAPNSCCSRALGSLHSLVIKRMFSGY